MLATMKGRRQGNGFGDCTHGWDEAPRCPFSESMSGSWPGRTVSHMLINYVISSSLPTNFNLIVRQWGATGNAALHHAEGITTKIGAETVTTNGVVEIVQGTINHPKIVTRGVTINTMQGDGGEAETKAGARVATRRIAEKRVKSAL